MQYLSAFCYDAVKSFRSTDSNNIAPLISVTGVAADVERLSNTLSTVVEGLKSVEASTKDAGAAIYSVSLDLTDAEDAAGIIPPGKAGSYISEGINRNVALRGSGLNQFYTATCK